MVHSKPDHKPDTIKEKPLNQKTENRTVQRDSGRRLLRGFTRLINRNSPPMVPYPTNSDSGLTVHETHSLFSALEIHVTLGIQSVQRERMEREGQTKVTRLPGGKMGSEVEGRGGRHGQTWRFCFRIPPHPPHKCRNLNFCTSGVPGPLEIVI